MRIYTVTKGGRPLAVVRAADPADAIDAALVLTMTTGRGDALAAREPDDAEMVGWLERRADYVVADQAVTA